MASYTESEWRETLPGHEPRGQGGFLKSRVHSLDLGQALLEAAHLLAELAQLLGDHLVVIHRC
jgi:hypothetical protein